MTGKKWIQKQSMGTRTDLNELEGFVVLRQQLALVQDKIEQMRQIEAVQESPRRRRGTQK